MKTEIKTRIRELRSEGYGYKRIAKALDITLKTFRDNHLTKRKVINNGELDQYIVENNHEAIISHKVFEEAQRVRKEKRKPSVTPFIRNQYPFKGMMRCGICGRAYVRKNNTIKTHLEMFAFCH